MQQSSEVVAGNEIDAVELVRALWSARLLVIIITGVVTLASVCYALLATSWYRAEVVLAPANNKEQPSGLSQLSSLASLAGFNLGTQASSEEAIAVLGSKELAHDFILERSLITVLLADQWDAGKKRWKKNDPEDQPDIRDAVEYFDKNVRAIDSDKKTGMVTLSITWKNADAAADWANSLVQHVNDRMRSRAQDLAERNITYLQNEMATTNVTTMQQSIGRVLETEMQKLLLARGNEEFAFKVIDRAAPPKERARPKRVLIVLAGFVGGGFLAVMFVYVRKRLSGLLT